MEFTDSLLEPLVEIRATALLSHHHLLTFPAQRCTRHTSTNTSLLHFTLFCLMMQVDATNRKEATKVMPETFYAAIFGYDEVGLHVFEMKSVSRHHRKLLNQQAHLRQATKSGS